MDPSEVAPGSITQWLGGLGQGDERAVQEIWERFFERASALARRRLGAQPQRLVDGEDLALSAFHALCAGARDQRFQQMRDRGDLWQVLAMITVRKAVSTLRSEGRRRELREADRSEHSSTLEAAMPSRALEDFEFVDSLSLTSAEMLERLEPKLREVALLRLEGYSNAEIAGRIDRSVASVERYLQMIRLRWEPVPS